MVNQGGLHFLHEQFFCFFFLPLFKYIIGSVCDESLI